MSNKNLLTLSVISSSALFWSPGLYAQNEGEEVYELSPFSVQADEDQGYVATTTLAGTRITTVVNL